MDPGMPEGNHTRRVHDDQIRRVTASVMGNTGSRSYERRRLIDGVSAALIRESVSLAITAALLDQRNTHADVAHIGAMAVERALASVGFTVEKIDGGWRGQLAHVEVLIHCAEDASTPGSPCVAALAEALEELHVLIDGTHDA